MTIFSINSGSFGDVTVTGIVSASTLKGDGSQITSVSYDNIASKPTLISSSTQVTALLPAGTLSSSAQVDITNTTGYDTFSGSLAAIDTVQTNRLNTIESFTGSYATTGSNTFTGIQTFSDTTNTTSYLDGAIHIAGGMSVRQDVRISGSMTINGLLTAVSMSTQYVTSSQYVVGTSRITLNDDDNVRFAGLSIIDSGSSSPTTASILWDSLQHRFIYENLSGSSYNSSIIIAGPKHTGSLGNEPTLTSGYIPYATGTDHIDNSVMFQSSSRIGIGITTPSLATLQINGNLHATSYTGSISGSSVVANTLTGTLQTAAQTNITSLGTLSSLTVSGNFAVDTNTLFVDAVNNRVGIGTASPAAPLHVAFGSGVNDAEFRLQQTTNGTAAQMTLIANNDGGAIYNFIRSQTNGGTEHWRISGGASVGTLAFSTNGNVERMRLDASGRLLIGTANGVGSDFVSVRYNSSTAFSQAINIVDANASANGSVFAVFRRSDDTYLGNIRRNSTDNALYVGGNSYLALGSGDTERARIDASGNFGIGTTSPGYKLDVNGSIRAGSGNTTGLLVQASGTATTQAAIALQQITTEGDTIIFADYEPFAEYGIIARNSIDSIDFTAGTSTNSLANYNITNRSGNARTAYVKARINLGGGEVYFGGNVGIGTTTPAERLHVSGNVYIGPGNQFTRYRTATAWDYYFAASGDNFLFYDSNSTNFISAVYNGGGTGKYLSVLDTLNVRNNGNVGIGTSTPDTQLTINRASDTAAFQQKFNIVGGVSAGNYMGIVWTQNTSTELASIRVNHNNNGIPDLVFGIRDYPSRIVMKNDGNVGIGTTSPQTKLDVTGRIQSRYSNTVSLSSTATTTLASLPLRCPVIASVFIYWNSNINGARQVLLYVGATDTGWGSPNSAITILANQDWSSGYVGTPTFTVGGSGNSRTLEISVGNAPATGTVAVTALASIIHLGEPQ